MKIALINENSQAAKNGIIHDALTTVVEPLGHEVHNYGMGTLSDFGGVYLSSADNLCFQKEPPLCHLPTLVHDNYIHDCKRYNYGCQGIYMVSRSQR